MPKKAFSKIKHIAYISIIVLFLAGCVQKEPEKTLPPETGSKVTDSAGYAIFSSNPPSPYASSRVLAACDEYPVTEDEVLRFAARTTGGLGQSHGDVSLSSLDKALAILPLFIRYQVAVNESLRLDLEKSYLFKERYAQVYRPLIYKFYLESLWENATIDPRVIKASIPDEWVQMDFTIRLVSGVPLGPEEYKNIKGKDRFMAFTSPDATYSKGSETGLVFQNSGFFDEWDEQELFDLKEGDIYGPVKTGVGLGIVYVNQRHDFTEQEKQDHITDLRSRLANKNVEKTLNAFRERSTITYDGKALELAIYKEAKRLGFSDSIVATVNGSELSYRMFRLIGGNSYSYIWGGIPTTNWFRIIKGDLEGIVDKQLYGQMAEEAMVAGDWVPTFGVQEEYLLYDYYKQILYYIFLEELISQFEKVDGENEQLRKFYEENPALFTSPAQADAIYYFTKDSDLSSKWLKLNQTAENFLEALEKALDLVPTGKFLPVLEKVHIRKGELAYEEMQEEIFRIKPGGFAVLKGTMGTYLFSVEKQYPEKLLKFEEVQDEVREIMTHRTFQKYLEKKIFQLIENAEIEILVEKKDSPSHDGNAPIMKDIPNLDMG